MDFLHQLGVRDKDLECRDGGVKEIHILGASRLLVLGYQIDYPLRYQM